MPNILIENLTQEEKRQLDIHKAKHNYNTWKQMFLQEVDTDKPYNRATNHDN